MSEQILITLKRKIDDLPTYSGLSAETRRNTLKEELQFYVLNFIYHHSKYSKWIMYGGSALRICHELDRMSADLDFEVPHTITREFLKNLKKEIEDYFSNTYGAESDFLTIKIVTGRGLILKFNIGEELRFGHPSKQVHVKIDLNYFVAPKIATERIPINHDQLSFIIFTYNMSALMASKIAAILLRGQRGVGKKVYNYKGRDIYDLLWYMDKRAVPDFDYLAAKGVGVKNFKELFNRLTIDILNYEKMDALLKKDLLPLFVDQTYITNWLENWREIYLRFLDAYQIHTAGSLESVDVYQDFPTDGFYFIYRYGTEDRKLIRITYIVSNYWIDDREGDLPVEIDKNLENKIEFSGRGVLGSIPVRSRPARREKLKQYATLFHQKTENYLRKTNRVVVGDDITTKIIRMTAKNLSQKEQVLLDKSALLSCELDELLK